MLELINEDVAECVTFFASNEDPETRKQYVKVLLQILSKPLPIVLSDITTIVASLQLVSNDADKYVRECLISGVPDIYIRCHELGQHQLDESLQPHLLEIVLRYLRDIDVEVSSKAFATTICLLQKCLLDKPSIEQTMCPSIVELSKFGPYSSYQNDNLRNAIELMKVVAPIVGPDTTQAVLLDRFLEMCSMEEQSVRKSCAEYFPVFCQVLGTEVTESLLLPVFVNLCEDPVWGIRKTATASLLKVAHMCSIPTRHKLLAPLVYKLMNDPSRWVGMMAFECLGQFIALFAKPCFTGLTYTAHGELYITNAANPDLHNKCNNDLRRNFAEHEATFEKARQPSEESTNSALHSLHLNNQTNNNNNHFYSGDNTAQNPLRQFMAPQQYDDVGMSTIEKLSRRLETFYGNLATSSSPKSSSEFNRTADHNTTATENSMNDTQLDEELELEETPQHNTAAVNATPEFNNNIELDEGHLATTIGVGSAGDAPTEAFASNNNNNGDMIDADSCNNQLFAEPTTDNAIPNSINVPSNTNSGADDHPAGARIGGKNKKAKNKHNACTETPPPPPPSINSVNHLSLLGPNTTTTTPPNAVRKNTPADLPMIIKQAIEHKDNNVSTRKGKRQKAMSLNIGLANQPPPETPLIEAAPQSIDFAASSSTPLASSADAPAEGASLALEPKTTAELGSNAEELASNQESVPTAVETESDFNKAINAMHYEDAFEEKLAHSLDVFAAKSDEDDDDDGSEFTSANYWYISPELPLDLDLFQEDVHSLQHQFNSITVDDIYNESMHRDKIHLQAASPLDNAWQTQLAKLQRSGGLHMHRGGNLPFRQDVVPGFLVRYFVAMVQFHDSDMNMHCVYNFPAVVLTLGPRYWHLSRDLLMELCEDLEWKNRKTVAMFIYQIGLIVGRELTGKDLVPIFMGFFKDLDEVKIEALRSITNFLQIVDIQHHHRIIFRLGCCLNTDNYANWRFREELAHQVLHLFEIYGNTYNIDGMIYLTGIAINLLSDDVCSVRDIALNAVVAAFKTTSTGHVDDLINLLTEEFANNSFWRRRQMYIYICHKLITEKVLADERFESVFLEPLLNLAKDPVPNIRLNVANLLAKALIAHDYFEHRPIYDTIVATLAALKCDADRDVRFMAGPQSMSAVEMDSWDNFSPEYNGEW